ncbi:385c44e6-ca74-43bf-a771-e5900dfd53c6 [Thermothielavioides terrestris]|uniref:Uncharacterized protein n=2 Tax=Thermothielavioides terrestris TaxID=2587410 RepID=G2QT00_THETT|nr:uncharacterized protein THITE_2085043 [Thermothielavioides terrestris NRRL 8126]AEO63525.1 hypothetical protein THITE_2085043 [Thermothielavioides terrestris NRRL 8126]SPQ20985.1 385c44e6-ca74-43bf-a771-e5900dfd53c6 [Thermothielavioides terrestris]
MSSRLTVPVSKLTRALSTTPAASRPSHVLNNVSKAAAAAAAGGRKPSALAEEPPSDQQQRNHSTTTTTTSAPHRPGTPRPRKPIPFMQTFHHSAPKPAQPTFATVDRAILPDLSLLAAQESSEAAGGGSGAYDPYLHIRVPLLPDARAPPAPVAGWRRPAEAADATPLPRAEICVVAAGGPAGVLPPAALTEVEGMGVDGVELGFAHLLGREEGEGESYEMGPGMIRDVWKGMVEDVFGGAGSSSSSGKGGPAAAA